ncbi:MAG: 5'-nucleotidase C-terminal domain-containing protein, partial [Candidatus Omnitrophota bacterium]|nr:5'-nucleotidase C-terminal domain-containing protein [Candidatus Omnitrophota bacterium]
MPKKRSVRRGILFVLIFLVLAGAVFFGLILKPAELTILFTHDLHSNLAPYSMPSSNDSVIEAGGYARLAAAIDRQRKGREDKTLVLDGGDFSMGTLFHTIRSTRSGELVAMGLMGFDATTFGNHEFDFGPAHLGRALLAAKKQNRARLPAIVSSNIVFDPKAAELAEFSKAYDEYPVLSFMVIKRGGLVIGLFGLVGKDAALYVPEAKPVGFSDPIKAARKTVGILRGKEKVDMVICLSHSGTWQDKSISEDEILAKSVPGIDVIISGHTHSILDPYIKVKNTYIVSRGSYGRYLGRLVLTRAFGGSFVPKDYTVIPVTSDLPEEAKIAGLVKSFEKEIDEEYLARFGYKYGQVLAEAPFSLLEPDWSKCSDRVKCMSSGLGDLVTDAFIYAVKKSEGENYREISLAFEGFGQIRSPIAKGPVTVNDAFRLLALGIGPDGLFGSGLCAFWLNGAEIKKAFELETTVASAKHDLHLQISGMRFSYQPKAPVFERVRLVEVLTPDGQYQPLEDSRLYRVVTGWKVLLMRKNLELLSGGKISFIPKDESGNIIADLSSTRVFVDSAKTIELKSWLAVAKYLQSFPSGPEGLPEIPEEYRNPQARV